MIDLPENEVRERHKPMDLFRFVNALKEQNNQTNNANSSKNRKVEGKSTNATSNVEGEENESTNEDNEELVNYKVGRLVMSILKEFKVSNILERFENVLVENVKISDPTVKDIPPVNTKTSLKHKRKTSKKSKHANHRDSKLLCTLQSLKNKTFI